MKLQTQFILDVLEQREDIGKSEYRCRNVEYGNVKREAHTQSHRQVCHSSTDNVKVAIEDEDPQGVVQRKEQRSYYAVAVT